MAVGSSSDGFGTVQETRMVDSTLWAENVYTLGHSSVWGSWYDAKNHRWGYACCRSVEREVSCARAAAEAAEQAAARPPPEDSDDDDDGMSSSEDEETKARREEWAKARENIWDDPPEALLEREAVEVVKESNPKRHWAFLEHFVRFAIGAWRRFLNDGKNSTISHDPGFQDMFRNTLLLQQAEADLSPLIQRLALNEKPKLKHETPSTLQALDKLVSLAAEREYAKAGQAYTDMTLGRKKWNNVLAQSGGVAQTNKGIRTYIVKCDDLLEYDKDPVVQKYVQCMRKLVYVVQCVRPNPDKGKHLRN